MCDLGSECCCGCFAVTVAVDGVVIGFGAAVSGFSFLAWVVFKPGLESLVFCFGAPGALNPPGAGSTAAGAGTGVGKDFLGWLVALEVVVPVVPCFGSVAAVADPSLAVAGEGFAFAELDNLAGPFDEASFVTFVSFSVDEEDGVGSVGPSFFTATSDSVVVDFSPSIPLASFALLSAFS